MAWNAGDTLNRQNLNGKTKQIVKSLQSGRVGSFGANSSEPITVSNETGAGLAEGEVCEIKDGYLDDDHIDAKGTAIDADTLHNRVVVAVESIDEGGAGLAVATGLVNCVVNITDVAHEYCMFEDGLAVLQSQAGPSRYRIIKAGLAETPVPLADARCLVLISDDIQGNYEHLIFRQEDSDLPAVGELFPAWTYHGPDAEIMAISTDRKTVGGSADADYQFSVDIDGVNPAKLSSLDLGTNIYFDDGVAISSGNKISLKTITAAPSANAQEVEVRLLMIFEKRFEADPRLQWGGTLT
jgi:hypothetical protein